MASWLGTTTSRYDNPASYEYRCSLMIMTCKNVAAGICKSKYQDELYGRGNRVFNKIPSQAGGEMGRCTVCKHEQGASSSSRETATVKGKGKS